jgi:hypothetical protein
MPILASPGTEPPVDTAEQWAGLEVLWTDVTGRTWDLNSPDDGVILHQGGVRGLGMPPITRYNTQAPALPGSRWRGHRVAEREAFWPLFVWGDTSDEWLARDRAWWRGLRPDGLGVWSIGTPDGQRRRLSLRYVEDGDPSFDVDPSVAGWYVYGLTLVAEQPYWEGEAVARTWETASTSPWFSGAGGVVTISPGNTVDTATIDNPGDVEAWPIWTVTGPCSTADLGIGGGHVALGAAVAGGASVVIDTRPDRMTATTDLGADISASVIWAPLPVPPAVGVPAAITLTGTGAGTRAGLSFTPLHYRAW